MALSFTEGSIGGDIESVSLRELERFYGRSRDGATDPRARRRPRPTTRPTPSRPGSNGFAIAPSNTVAKHALLWINPHTTFFFRSELQMTSDAGLNAYGAATWGQPFIYQGFNERVGWMHPTSGADVVDEFAESVIERDGRRFYRYAGGERPVVDAANRHPVPRGGGPHGDAELHGLPHAPRPGRARGRRAAGSRCDDAEADRGAEPVVPSHQGALTRRVPRGDGAGANSTNNTVYADADGNIAFFMPQFLPKRDDRFDRAKPADGSDPATEWRGVHAVDETPHVVNPASGWVANTNNWPYSVAGANSPKASAFPRYMDADGENPRGEHAALGAGRPARLHAAAADRRGVRSVHARVRATRPDARRGMGRRAGVEPRARAARRADRAAARVGLPLVGDVGADDARRAVGDGAVEPQRRRRCGGGARRSTTTCRRACPASEKLDAWPACSIGWIATSAAGACRGETSTASSGSRAISRSRSATRRRASRCRSRRARWGSLASLGARTYPGTRRRYGTGGNTFIAVVEFGDSVRARAISPGRRERRPAIAALRRPDAALHAR